MTLLFSVLPACVVLLVVVLLVFVGKIKKLQNQILERENEISAWKRHGSEFVANISHELKTPLTSIKGYTETLKTAIERDPSRALEFLTRIEENTDRLSRLISDILELSRIEQPNVYLERVEFSLADLFNEIRDRFQFRLNQRQQILTFSAELANIRADRWLLEQALSNLIENAHRYCQDGAQISVVVESVQESGKPYTMISVADNGPGINAEDLPRIFERFYRAEKSRNRLFGGTGLGLAIVKHIMMSHHGSARAESKLGEGSRFSLLFPQDH